jgi:hypothetical protein
VIDDADVAMDDADVTMDDADVERPDLENLLRVILLCDAVEVEIMMFVTVVTDGDGTMPSSNLDRGNVSASASDSEVNNCSLRRTCSSQSRTASETLLNYRWPLPPCVSPDPVLPHRVLSPDR